MPIETGSQILNYVGNSNLGLGSNSSIPAIDPKANLDFINQTARDIAMMNHANNIKLFEQKIKDRDDTLGLLASGQIAAGKIDPNDRKVYDAAKKEVSDNFYEMIRNGGINNPEAVRKYYDSVGNLKNVATWAQSRQLEFDKLNAEKSTQTLDEDIERFDGHIKKMKEQPFWNPIVPMQKAFNYDVDEMRERYKGNPTTGQNIEMGSGGTATTQWNTVTDKNGVITNKTTTKTAPLKSAQLTRQVPKTGVTVKPDGSLSEISYTPEKYWDYDTMFTNVQEAYISSPKDRQGQIEWFNDVNAYPDAEKIRLLKAYNNRIAQYNQEREIQPDGTNPDGTPHYSNQVKYAQDPATGKILIQETPTSFMAKHALASIEGNYVEKPKPVVDYKIAEINKDVKLAGIQAATQRRGQDLDYKVAWKNAETSRINALKEPKDSEAKFNANIQSPAILFGQHIDRVKSFFDKNPNKDLSVNYSGTDAKTRLATGLEEGETIVFRPDGSYVIKQTDGKQRIGTIEDLKQGFMNAVKSGLTSDGSQTEGFQTQAEEGFDNIFGTRSGDAIFKGWGTNKPSSGSNSKDKPIFLADDHVDAGDYIDGQVYSWDDQGKTVTKRYNGKTKKMENSSGKKVIDHALLKQLNGK